MDVLFRDYRKGDFIEINRLWKKTGLGGEERGDDENVIERTLANGGKLLVAENPKTGKIIGTSWLTTDHRRIYIHHFGIAPEYQRNGIGEKMAYQTLNFVKEKGMQVKLEVHRTNQAAIRLYEKTGFKYLGDYIIFIIRDINQISDNLPLL